MCHWLAFIDKYRHIIQEFQMQITAATQRNKFLESENRMLLAETEQLREVMMPFFRSDFFILKL